MKVYWCNVQQLLLEPSPFIEWCNVRRIPWTDYLCIEDAIRHFAGLQLRSIAQQEHLRFMSVSHCGGLVLCAVSKLPVGIDTEEYAPVPSVPGEFFTDEERAWMEAQANPEYAFYRLWTRKESIIKAGNAVLSDVLLLPSLIENGTLKQKIGTLEIQELSVMPDKYCTSIGCEEPAHWELIELSAEQLFDQNQ